MGFTDICDSEKSLQGCVCEGYCDGSGQEKEAPRQQGRDVSPGK